MKEQKKEKTYEEIVDMYKMFSKDDLIHILVGVLHSSRRGGIREGLVKDMATEVSFYKKESLDELFSKQPIEAVPKINLLVTACPVCNGNGLVPNGFYRQTSGNWMTTDLTPEKCRSCDGTGVIRT